MNSKKIAFLAVIAILSGIFSSNAQNVQTTGSVSGKIIDKETGTALDYVSVTIFRSGETKPQKAVVTGSDGSFTIDQVLPGNYRLEATFIGYKKYSHEIKIAQNIDTKLSNIQLETDARVLGSVEITGIRSAMKFDIDKKVFSVDQAVASSGANASEILKEIPSVEVDQEGTVSLRNSSNVTIWINGKPSGLNSDNQGQVLEQMPAESIDKIEVITNPSSKFSAEGSAGIINIILKKERKAGYFGSLRAGAGYPESYNAGASFNYSSSKVDFNANIGTRYNKHDGYGTSDRMTFSTNENQQTDTTWLNSQSSRNSNMNGLFFRGGLDYHINDKHTIGFSGMGRKGSHYDESNITYLYLDRNRFNNRTTQRNSETDDSNNNYDITLDYMWDIAEEHKFQTSLSYGQRSGEDESKYFQSDLFNPGGSIFNTNQIQNDISSNKELEFQADYTRKLSEKFRLEAGLKSEWSVRNSTDMIYDNTLAVSSMQPSYQNDFDYDEKIHAVYGTITGKMNTHFGYQLGLRGELSDITFSSFNRTTNTSIDKDKNYFNLFPSIFLTYSFEQGSDIQLNYSRRINRPRGRSLNPFVNISDSTNIRSGNPDLDPFFGNSFELNYIKSWDNHTLSASLYHRIDNNIIQEIRYIKDNVMYQSPINITDNTSSGLELVSKNSFTNKLETTATFNFYRTALKGFTYDNYYYEGNEGFSWNARLNSTIILSNSMTAQISGFVTSPRIVAQGEMSGSYAIDAGIKKTFFDKKLSVSINGRNLLDSFRFDNKSWGKNFYQESSNKFFRRSIQCSVTWNFGNMTPKKKNPDEENGESNGYSESE
jgi:outer membrane receptor protein involved in Fe transport